MKTNGTKNSLKAGTRVAVPPRCRVNYGFDWTELLEEKGWEIALMIHLKPVHWSAGRPGFDPDFGLTSGSGVTLNWQCFMTSSMFLTCFTIISLLTNLLNHAAKSLRLKQTGWYLTICLPYLLCTSDDSFMAMVSRRLDDCNSWLYPPLFNDVILDVIAPITVW